MSQLSGIFLGFTLIKNFVTPVIDHPVELVQIKLQYMIMILNQIMKIRSLRLIMSLIMSRIMIRIMMNSLIMSRIMKQIMMNRHQIHLNMMKANMY